MSNLRRKRYKRGPGSLLVIAAGFAVIILLGALLLSLPWAAQDRHSIGFFDALFTSTSAVCVTGLVVRDTGTTFSLFGQLVLMGLIEVGGLGFMTFATLIFWLLGREISLRERMLIQESMNETGVGGMDELISWVLRSAFTVQGAGALLLALRFVPRFGWGKGLYFSFFHAVSAYCNAGFDLFGGYSSLTGFRADVLVNVTIMLLIVVGGLGFGVLRNLVQRLRGGYLYLQTRLVLCTYGLLTLFGFLFTLVAEWSNPGTLGSLPVGEKLLAALFQSVTLRTAGFNTISQHALHPATKFVSGFLMLVGASPASTGGGIKVTTLAVIVLCVRATARGDRDIVAFKRELPMALVQRAVAVALIAGTVAATDITLISLLQPELDFMDILMECTSAMGTVGISAFGSASLDTIPRVLIMLTMYLGRIGPLTMALLLSQRQNAREPRLDYPGGNVMIG